MRFQSELSGCGSRLFGPVFEARYRDTALYTFLLFLRKGKECKDERKAPSYLGGGGGVGGGRGGGGGGGEGTAAKKKLAGSLEGRCKSAGRVVQFLPKKRPGLIDLFRHVSSIGSMQVDWVRGSYNCSRSQWQHKVGDLLMV